ncbi:MULTISPECIES: histidine kinase [unclassified Microbacterium]|uniref:sensor histidine kinase n=1 Tax=unclassified Microbacterium TaxID=2609290 RepID=UPI00214BD62C|nr:MULTISPECIES: histidine kinase [unclassified Microbacterium]MCR2784398.1 histidine kinase [Microbacterium sp. zg.B96]MDL5350692.1 histidine kinase [Microbacterium sp. zg-YB36]WIM14784.1 histidine kinase [Microbacterium sp. zg-B96]
MSGQTTLSRTTTTPPRVMPPRDVLGEATVAGVALLMFAATILDSPVLPRRWVELLLLIVSTVPVLWRTRAPVPALALVLGMQTVLFVFLEPPIADASEAALIATSVALGTVASRCSFWVSVAALVFTSSCIAFFLLDGYPPSSAPWAFFSSGAVCCLSWGLGSLARVHNARIAHLQAEQKRVTEMVQAQRGQIASELNRIIASAVTGMLGNAGMATQTIEQDPQRAARALAAIESTGVEALSDVRRLMGVLRDSPAFSFHAEPATAESIGRGPIRHRLLHLDRSDVIIGAGAALLSAAVAALSLWGDARWSASAFLAVTLCVLMWRNRFPVTVFALVLVSLASAVLLFNAGDFVWETSISLLPVLLSLFAVSSGAPVWASVPALLIAWIYLAVPALAYPRVLTQNLVVIGVISVTVWVGGLLAGRRRRRIARLESVRQAAEAAADRDRARLARDLHDVIGHSITGMILQAAGARRILAQDPQRAAAALPEIESAGAAAMRELEQFVGLLQGASARHTSDPPHPSAGLADIDALIAQNGSSLGRIERTSVGDPQRLEPSVDLAAYYVIREALTNAAKHAGPDARVEIAVRWGDDRVRLQVTSTPSAKVAAPLSFALGGGYGLIGARERARVAGGDLTWTAQDGAFTVAAALPTSPVR